MRHVRQFVLAMLVLVAGVSIGCTDANAPTSSAEISPSFSTAEQEATKEARQQRHEELKRLLKLHQEHVKRQKELRKGEYELARAEWKLFKGEWKEQQKQLKRAKKGQSTTLMELDLLRCKPRPFEGAEAIIGSEGGTLDVGEHQLIIPKGALTEEQLIVAEAPTSSLVDVEFYPEGLQFAKSAKLILSYKDCQVPTDIDLRLAYVGWGLRILELPPSKDFKDLSEVIGDIDHFSRYALAY